MDTWLKDTGSNNWPNEKHELNDAIQWCEERFNEHNEQCFSPFLSVFWLQGVSAIGCHAHLAHTVDAHRPETSQRGRTKLRVEAHARRLQTAYLYLEIEITRCPHDCLKALAALASLASLAVRLDRLVSIKRFAIRIVELPKLTQLVAPKWFCHSLHVRASPATQCYSPISRELCNPNLNR